MSESIGASLRAAREKRQLTLAQVSEITRLRSHYLQALENDDISTIPSAAQARGFLKLYAEFLGLDVGTLVSASIPNPPAAAPEAARPAVTPAASQPDSRTAGPSLLARLGERLANLRKGRAGASEAVTDEAAPADSPGGLGPDADQADKKKAPS